MQRFFKLHSLNILVPVLWVCIIWKPFSVSGTNCNICGPVRSPCINICTNFNEILLQFAISSTYLRKGFVKENVVFKAKKQNFQKKEWKGIPRLTKRLKFWYFLKTINRCNHRTIFTVLCVCSESLKIQHNV